MATAVLSATLATQFAPGSVLVVGRNGQGGRNPFPTDGIVTKIVQGESIAPKEGDTWKLATGAELTWKILSPKTDGWFEAPELQGGYAYWEHESEIDTIMLLEAAGHSMVYVNGVPRGGDVYGFGYMKLPVHLQKGTNRFLFAAGRGRMRAALSRLPADAWISADDPTLPDVMVGERKDRWVSVMVVNGSHKPLQAKITGKIGGTQIDPVPATVAPMTLLKVPVQIPHAEGDGKAVQLELKLVSVDRRRTQGVAFDLAIKKPTETHKRTFVSETDGSVQYYAVQPATDPARARGMVLSLHGASVEATGQAAAYGQKTWCNIVCPTNRRPYGFDWEDWGETDAFEALDDARTIYQPDPSQLYLTGHSMGGHGTWFIGSKHPGTFAAVGPCAGWASFWTYAGAIDYKDPDPIQAMLRRAANESDTFQKIENLKSCGVYVVHGDADETVPVAEARTMREKLAVFHRDLDWHEQPGGGHWYDTTPEPGADCEDYPPMFSFFGRRRVAAADQRRAISLTTFGPGPRDGPIQIVAQGSSRSRSKAEVDLDLANNRLSGVTENVSILRVHTKGKLTIEMAGSPAFEARPEGGSVLLQRGENGWSQFEGRWDGKRPGFAGPFKTAFGRDFLLVYATGGTDEENEWSFNKARFDAESWAYRGNGKAELVSDKEFSTMRHAGRNFILYGNRNMLTCWKSVIQPALIDVTRQLVMVGDKTQRGSLAVLACIPYGADPGVTIGVVGGTDLKGMRATERLPYFLAGVHYPDFTAFSPETWTKGSDGVAYTGFFSDSWTFKADDMAIR